MKNDEFCSEMRVFGAGGLWSGVDGSRLESRVLIPNRAIRQVSFQRKNPDFLSRNPDFLF